MDSTGRSREQRSSQKSSLAASRVCEIRGSIASAWRCNSCGGVGEMGERSFSFIWVSTGVAVAALVERGSGGRARSHGHGRFGGRRRS
jgi:hypothetical protein